MLKFPSVKRTTGEVVKTVAPLTTEMGWVEAVVSWSWILLVLPMFRNLSFNTPNTPEARGIE